MASFNSCLGRTGLILDKVYSVLNDTAGGTTATNRHTTPEAFIAWMNQEITDLALRDLWTATASIQFEDGVASYFLPKYLPGFLKLLAFTLDGVEEELEILTDVRAWLVRKSTTPAAYTWPLTKVFAFLSHSTLEFYPTPADTGKAVNCLYSRLPGQVGQITLSQAAVVNKGGGLVGIPAPANGCVVNDEVDFGGTTNYNGNYLVASATTNEFVIQDTYVAETLGAGATCYRSPPFPQGHDGILVWHCLLMQSKKDQGRRKDMIPTWEMEKRQAVSELLKPTFPVRVRPYR